MLDLPNTALATAIDLGDITSPFTNIHPRNKQTLGARLAANALSQVRFSCCAECNSSFRYCTAVVTVQVYGMQVPRLSPVFANATGAVSGEVVTVTVSFQPETVVDGLTIIPGATCPKELPAWAVSRMTALTSGASAVV